MYYGDALFETIRVFEGRAPYLRAHVARLTGGLRLLGFEVPDEWSADFFLDHLQKIAPRNARVRLTVWRAPGGLYLPADNTPHWLLAAGALEHDRFVWPERGLLLGVCASVRLPVDAYSNLKTLNAPRYGAAAREAAAKGYDDTLILNAFERVCEATSSNVFWWENDTLCTPPLAEGCVAGVLRAEILRLARQEGLAVQEKPATFAAVCAADEIFLTNAVRGMIPAARLGEKSLSDARTRAFFDRHFNRPGFGYNT